jgi:4-amino-4-deoxy-L-arabinose transferase-like glycosyltransferase
VLVVGVALRVAYLGEVCGSLEFSCPAVDEEFHDYWARGLATGDWTPPDDYEDPLIGSTPYLRPPGYPFFLAGVYRLAGHGYLAPRIAQTFVGLINCLLTYLMARKVFGAVVGLIAALMMSSYWIFIYFESKLHEPVLLIGLGLLLVYLLSLWSDRTGVLRSLAAGLVLGVFALVRPTVLPFGGAVVAWMLWTLRRGRLRLFPASGLAFVAGALLAIAPVTVRNWIVARDFVLISSNAGVNLIPRGDS